MAELRNNLLGGTAGLAQFLGIGRGLKAPAGRVEPVATPPAAVAAASQLAKKADDGDNAGDDDDDGKDAPDDNDDEETKKAKQQRREARQKAREKAEKEKSAEDDSDSEMRGGSPLALARLRERARCAAIFACEAAAGNPDMAAHFAFNTAMTREEAITALGMLPKPAAGRPPLRERMAAVPQPVVAANGDPAQTVTPAQRVLAARDKARGKAA